MIDHDCIIGLLHHCDYSELVTIEELEDHITDSIMFNVMVKSDPILKNCEILYRKEMSLKDYADKRKNTDLTRFDFCPYCGKQIDWKAIRRNNYG